MKTTKTVLLAALAACTIVGCALFKGDAKVTPDRAFKIARLSAWTTATAVLAVQPEGRKELEKALGGFDSLCAQSTWDMAAAATIAGDHGLYALASEEGSIALQGVPLLVDAILDVELNLKSEPYAKAAITGIRDGLALALGGTRSVDDTGRNLRAEAAATRPRK